MNPNLKENSFPETQGVIGVTYLQGIFQCVLPVQILT